MGGSDRFRWRVSTSTPSPSPTTIWVSAVRDGSGQDSSRGNNRRSRSSWCTSTPRVVPSSPGTGQAASRIESSRRAVRGSPSRA